ncbi:MAG: hypothetical protein H0W74_04715 [Sphingosinicella sp.]|nr:hypothetical protein [Sphingosinicella sp.]
MAKEKRTKLPSKIGGVKIPKELRKAGEAAAEWARGPVISEIAAAAMMAAATSLASSRKGQAARRGAGDLASETIKEATAVGTAVKLILIDAARTLLDGYEGGGKSEARPKAPKGGTKSGRPAGKKK